MNTSAKLTSSMLIGLSICLSPHAIYAYNHKPALTACKSAIEQDERLKGGESFSHGIKRVFGTGNVRNYFIRTTVTTADGEKSKWKSKCKANTKGVIKELTTSPQD